MIRLSNPKYSFEQSISECCDGIKENATLKQQVEVSSPLLIAAGAAYLLAAKIGDLYTTIPLKSPAPADPCIINNLKRSDLIKLYDQYMVATKKPARAIYDSLLNSAKEQCPFCGGIGTPRNLDHFLPKTHFPQFSIFPHNLIPSCRDCNMDGKAQSYATQPEDQIIHPYSDSDIFFSDQWIFAKYNPGKNDTPGLFEYFTNPPATWQMVDKKRAEKHFHDFSIAKRYSTKSAEFLGTVLQQVKRMQQKGITTEVIKTILLQPGVDEASFVNHWMRGMYQALINDLF